jgi:Zn-dependent protease with chaperone function
MVLMPPFWDWQVLWVAIPFTVWHLWYATGGLIQLCRWTRILKHLPQSESAMLDDCFAKLQIRPRAILVLSSPFALAYAFPFRKELVFTRGFLDKCAPEEMKVICLHELAHLNEDWAMLTRRLLVSFIFYPFIFVRPAIHTWELPGLLLIYALFILLILARRVGRKGELRADQVAATHELDAGLYARALERIYMLNQIPAVMRGKRHIHPHLYDRMIASGVTPDFPRPKPPGFLNWTILIPMIGLLIFAVYFYVRVGMN